jgi:hypothetical protein
MSDDDQYSGAGMPDLYVYLPDQAAIHMPDPVTGYMPELDVYLPDQAADDMSDQAAIHMPERECHLPDQAADGMSDGAEPVRTDMRTEL